MAEIPTSVIDDCESSLSCFREIGLGEEKTLKMGVLDQEGLLKRSEMSDSFVLDIETLSRVSDRDGTANSKRTLQRNLSRKGSQGGERKTLERETTDSSSKGAVAAICTVEKVIDLPLVRTTATDPTTNINTGENKGRKYSRCSSTSVNRRSSWIDPRRVLLVFATLSSMGTMILIYFTLSVAKINEDGPQIQ